MDLIWLVLLFDYGSYPESPRPFSKRQGVLHANYLSHSLAVRYERRILVREECAGECLPGNNLDRHFS